MVKRRLPPKRASLVVAALLGTAVLTSCSYALFIELANETTQSVTLAYSRSGNETVEVSMPPGARVEIAGLANSTFSIRNGTSTATYELPSVPYDYRQWTGWGPFQKPVVMAKLRSDGCVVVARTAGSNKGPMESRDPDRPSELAMCPQESAT